MCRLPHKTCLMSFIIVHPLNESSWTNQERGCYAKSFTKSFNWRHKDLAAVQSVASIVAIPTRCMISDGGQASMTPKRVQQQKKLCFYLKTADRPEIFIRSVDSISGRSFAMKALVLVSILDLSGQKKRAREFRQPFKQGSTKDSPWRFFITFLQSAKDLWRSGVLSTQVSNEKDLGCLKHVVWGLNPTQLCGDHSVNHGFRISIKQPGFNGIRKGPRVLWTVAHVFPKLPTFSFRCNIAEPPKISIRCTWVWYFQLPFTRTFLHPFII